MNMRYPLPQLVFVFPFAIFIISDICLLYVILADVGEKNDKTLMEMHDAKVSFADDVLFRNCLRL